MSIMHSAFIDNQDNNWASFGRSW